MSVRVWQLEISACWSRLDTGKSGVFRAMATASTVRSKPAPEEATGSGF